MKYIFIDTNQYRHIFSKNEGFSDEIKNLLDGLIEEDHVKMLLPQQVKDEVERNRFEEWYNGEVAEVKKKIEKIKSDFEQYTKDLSDFPAGLREIEKKNRKKIARLEKELLVIKKRYRNLRSKANQKLKALFNEAEFIEEHDGIIQKARWRLEKNNPPKDNKLGDALIWESIIDYLQNAEKGSTLIFVARDGGAWGKNGFNPWLARELKEKTGVSISLTKALSDLDYLTKEEQRNLRKIESEESKNNAILNFINSQSFISAGTNIKNILAHKKILTKSDYQKIVNASISNHEIYQSFFTSIPLNELCAGKDNFVVSYLEGIDSKDWKKFVELNDIHSKRQVDQVELDDVDTDDFPF